MRRTFLVIALGAIGAACASFTGNAAPTTGNGGDGGAPPSGDAAPAFDSGSDSASTVADADVDAGPFCPSDDSFVVCDDFERSSLIVPAWALANTGKPDQDPTIGTPPTPFAGLAAVFSLVKDGASDQHKYLYLAAAPIPLAGRSTVTAEVAFLAAAPLRLTDLISFAFSSTGPPPTSLSISFASTADGKVSGSSQLTTKTSQSLGESGAVAPNSWAKLTVTIKLPTTGPITAHVTAACNDVTFADMNVPALNPTDFSMSLGPDYADPGDPGPRWIDNVKVKLED